MSHEKVIEFGTGEIYPSWRVVCVVIGRIPIPQKFIDQQRRDDACIVFLVWILYFGSYFPIQLRKELNGGYDYAMVWLRETLRNFRCVRNVWSQAFQLERCGLSLHSPVRSLRVCLSQFVVCHLRCPETEKGVSNFCNQVGAWGDTFGRSGAGVFLVSQPRPPTSVRHASSANAGCSHVLRKCKSTRWNLSHPNEWHTLLTGPCTLRWSPFGGNTWYVSVSGAIGRERLVAALANGSSSANGFEINEGLVFVCAVCEWELRKHYYRYFM